MLFSSLGKLFSSKTRIFLYLLLVIVMGMLWWVTTDVAVTIGNLASEGKGWYVYMDILLSGIIVLLFPLFLIAIGYRGYVLGGRKAVDKKTSLGAIGGVIGVILSGCSCCGITLASSLGFLPLMSFVPYEGLLGVKILGTIGLLYALYEVLTHLESCKMQKRDIQ